MPCFISCTDVQRGSEELARPDSTHCSSVKMTLLMSSPHPSATAALGLLT